MNCKPGDLAIVIKSHSGNEGVIVKIDFFVGEVKFKAGTHYDCWMCIAPGFYGDCEVPDKYLRPVSGLPMEDEIIEKQKEPA